MDEKSLQIFADVARSGSLAEAARRRAQDPSLLSRTLSSLEVELGAKLIERTTRRMTLTRAGQKFLEEAEAILAAMADARLAVRQPSDGMSGRVRLTASVAFGERVIMPLMAGLIERYPALGIDAYFNDDPLDLAAERIDLAVRLGPQLHGQGFGRKLCDVRYYVCASPALLDARGEPQRPDDCAAFPILGYVQPALQRRWRFKNSEGALSDVPLNAVHTISSALSVLSACRAGLGLALLADWLVDPAIRDGSLRVLFPEHEVTASEFGTAAWLMFPLKERPPRVDAVADYLAEHIAKRAH